MVLNFLGKAADVNDSSGIEGRGRLAESGPSLVLRKRFAGEAKIEIDFWLKSLGCGRDLGQNDSFFEMTSETLARCRVF